MEGSAELPHHIFPTIPPPPSHLETPPNPLTTTLIIDPPDQLLVHTTCEQLADIQLVPLLWDLSPIGQLPPLPTTPVVSPVSSHIPCPLSIPPISPPLPSSYSTSTYNQFTPSTPQSLLPPTPITPLTPAEALASQASVDSGVTSAFSSDFSHNSASIEVFERLRRTMSSVSSGTSEMWQGSLDGDTGPLEALPEIWTDVDARPLDFALDDSDDTCNSSKFPRCLPSPPPSPIILSDVPFPSIPLQPPPDIPSPPSSPIFPLKIPSPPPSPIFPLKIPSPPPPLVQLTETGHSQVPDTPVLKMAVSTERQSISPPNKPTIEHSRPPSPINVRSEAACTSVITLESCALSLPFNHTASVCGSQCEHLLQSSVSKPASCVNVNNSSKYQLSSRTPPTGESLEDFSSKAQSNHFKTLEFLKFSEQNVSLSKYYSAYKVTKLSIEKYLWVDKFASKLVKHIVEEAITLSSTLGWSIKCSGQCHREQCREDYQRKEASASWMGSNSSSGGIGSCKSNLPLLGLSCGSPGLCWTPELPYSPSHRPHSRTSLGSTLSFSHDSLVSAGPRLDDSHLITGAVSHDALLFSTSKASKSNVDARSVPIDGDIYAVPVDVVKPHQIQVLHPKAIIQQPKKRHHRRHPKVGNASGLNISVPRRIGSSEHTKRQGRESGRSKHSGQTLRSYSADLLQASKRHSVPSNIGCALTTPKQITNKENSEAVHMTLDEVRKSFHESDDTLNCHKSPREHDKCSGEQSKLCRIIPFTSMKSCKRKDTHEVKDDTRKKGRSISSNIRNTLITLFGFRKTNRSTASRVKNVISVDGTSSELYEPVDNGGSPTIVSPTPPTGPPLNHSTDYSAFTNHVSSNTTTNRIHQQPLINNNSQPNHHKQSNGISPTGLLSCLGNSRTGSNEFDETQQVTTTQPSTSNNNGGSSSNRSPGGVTNRALPPLPGCEPIQSTINTEAQQHIIDKKEEEGCDFASIIEKVKDYGWYWGPISGEAAEKVLSNEPDGSFIVRDSSDHHYIFSLTFKLNGFIRHVRIEHDQGNFSFGGFTKFKSQTIVEFIENAVEHSRSGRYLFFLHRRPVLGPMRVQLLHPVSRFKHIQSLQHLCRFVIVKHVRRDLIGELPLPQRLKDYLCSPHYYSEQVEQCMAAAASAATSAVHTDRRSPHIINRRSLQNSSRCSQESERRSPTIPDRRSPHVISRSPQSTERRSYRTLRPEIYNRTISETDGNYTVQTEQRPPSRQAQTSTLPLARSPIISRVSTTAQNTSVDVSTEIPQCNATPSNDILDESISQPQNSINSKKNNNSSINCDLPNPAVAVSSSTTYPPTSEHNTEISEAVQYSSSVSSGIFCDAMAAMNNTCCNGNNNDSANCSPTWPVVPLTPPCQAPPTSASPALLGNTALVPQTNCPSGETLLEQQPSNDTQVRNNSICYNSQHHVINQQYLTTTTTNTTTSLTKLTTTNTTTTPVTAATTTTTSVTAATTMTTTIIGAATTILTNTNTKVTPTVTTVLTTAMTTSLPTTANHLLTTMTTAIPTTTTTTSDTSSLIDASTTLLTTTTSVESPLSIERLTSTNSPPLSHGDNSDQHHQQQLSGPLIDAPPPRQSVLGSPQTFLQDLGSF